MREALDDLKKETQGRRVSIAIGALPPCQADPLLLRQVFANLLSNALKYTRRCDAAVISIGCRPEGAEQVYFVRDNGAGFNMRHAAHLFQVFRRLHSAQEFEGLGVGLAIVKRIVQRHGGRIWAEAAPGAGAAFYFTMGSTAPDLPNPKPPEPPAP